MSFVLTLLLAYAAAPLQTHLEQAFAGFQSNNWQAAAAALDAAQSEQPALFAANNLHYLRGRVAESLGDWQRAREEFKLAGQNNPLSAPALWRAARASAKLRDDAAMFEFLGLLPLNFPRELKYQVAQEAGGEAALKIYRDIGTREARYELAQSAGDHTALWRLIREGSDDDVALQAARVVAATASGANDQMTVAEIFANHREFDAALPLYQEASKDPAYAADARYRIARIHFQKENYPLAIAHYQAIAKDFAGSDWEKEAEYQIAACYWRLGDYRNSEKAYLGYIQKYGRTGMREAATRNLIDVYRALGEHQKALAALDRALAGSLTVSNRQVFLFTKAKVLYLEKRYSAALAIFQQLGRSRLRSAPGAATAEEVQYFQALCQSKLGNKTAAATIWKRLARDEFSYYGQRAAEKLGRDSVRAAAPACSADRNAILTKIESNVDGSRRSIREEMDPTADVVSELLFLRLWDEAAMWMELTGTRPPGSRAAEIAYLGGRYNRSISAANRLPKNSSTLPLQYPAGYRHSICDASGAHKADPLWLHAIIWQESKYNPHVRSGAGARGLMQFIPETARSVAESIGIADLPIEKLYDPAVSIRLGAAYWTSLMEQLKSPELALAAYNGGPVNVERWRAKSSDPELFVSDIGFVETKRYVMLVFAARAAYASMVD
jgi:soluble lytic murein transglycosylase-like protein